MADTASPPSSAPPAPPSSELAAEVGRILATARGPRSLREFAKANGLAFSTIHELEQGLNNPTLARLERVAAMYGVRLHILAGPLPPGTAP